MTTDQLLAAIYQFLPLIGLFGAFLLALSLYSAIGRAQELEERLLDALGEVRTHLIAKAPQSLSSASYYGLDEHRDEKGRFKRRTNLGRGVFDGERIVPE